MSQPTRTLKRMPSNNDFSLVLKRKLEKIYFDFFQKLGINKQTGCLERSPYKENHPNKKFPTYPYIGSKYGTSKKILFVGIDIGCDPKSGGILSFHERKWRIENKPVSKHNPHIAGTYCTALFFLRETLNWEGHWEKIKDTLTCQRALKNHGNSLPQNNPLSYVALTNYFKFTFEEQKKRSTKGNQKYLNEDIEQNLFLEELNIFDPDIIIFQGKNFLKKQTMMDVLKETGRDIYIGPHPSWRGKGKRKPEYFVHQIKRGI